MSTLALEASSIDLCPINFKKFDDFKKQVGNIEEALLLAKIRFHLQNSKITKNGSKCIARSREKISSWYGFSLRKTDELLKSLEKKGFISYVNGMWYGVKKLFISEKSTENTTIPINISLFSMLIEVTESVNSALAYSRIAYTFAQTKKHQNDLPWCFLRKRSLASYLDISIRTLDKILENLIKKGLLIKKNLVSCGRRQTHFHIPISSLKALKKRFMDKANSIEAQTRLHEQDSSELKGVLKAKIIRAQSCKNCRLEPAKSATSIRIRTPNKKKTTNNTEITVEPNKELNRPQETFKDDTNFSKTQISYIGGAIKTLIERDKVRISDVKSLVSEVKYAVKKILEKGVLGFKYAVNRICSIVRSGNWSTPFGFYKYTQEGKILISRKEEHFHEHQKRKQENTQNTSIFNEFLKNKSNNFATKEALNIADAMKKMAEKIRTFTGDSTVLRQVVEKYYVRLQDLIRQGADRDLIMASLKA